MLDPSGRYVTRQMLKHVGVSLNYSGISFIVMEYIMLTSR